MLTDPQSITVNAIAKSLVRINQDNNSSTYRLRSTTDEYLLTIKYTDGKITGGVEGESHNVRLKYTVFAVGSVPATTLYATINLQNQDGADLTVARNCLLGLQAWNVSATIDKLLTGES
jgi:hypothetical protein